MPIVTLPGGELRDEIRQPAYDTITLAAGDAIVGVCWFFWLNLIVVNQIQPKKPTHTNSSNQT